MLRFIGPTELIIILIIVVIVFGVGRLPEVGGALGKGIRDFKKGLQTEEDAKPKEATEDKGQADASTKA